ncbi:MAG: 4-hydroxy-tetrahydrodipicolinate synthase [Rhodospirillaceae bacterium]|jgi:4-hydroxy-tetrahydrodipicolinate synthase|nr:4-hydroxy-tetrahydrodipicolinate synthase [Rhodospirillaceae bacterium]MBT6404654.1 4-hydroxy-tetrahydrodipicolinate synthase [Rhodospirillaceae bacterium]MBT6535597.1 4-hydroxy-tetrahydrodipicolinate synthase [Rhodospirillaceae bacterium]MBT7362979.1 4-hydroxy-tetrahydrodipicolinate synthase [Rhodospirillaceae bacterium]
MFKGSMTALITPFRDGKVDEKAYQGLVEWQIDEGTDGVIPVGTTGESPTLSHGEHERVVEMCVEAAAGRIPVIAGAGSNSTEECVRLTEHAKTAGADAALIVTPYYNKPSQDGLYAHFKTVADAVDIPIIIYNIPPRSVIDMSTATMARLARDCPNIIGVKDATADLTRPLAMRQEIGDDFCMLSGEDATVMSFLANGGDGCISVTSNAAPRACAEMHDAWLAGDTKAAMDINARLFPLHTALFVEPNPVPVKYAASLLEKCTMDVRLPLTPANENTQKLVRDAMVSAGLLN